MDKHVIKVFGERNTGTRAVIAMLGQLPDVTRRISALNAPSPDGSLEAAILENLKGAWKRLYLHGLRDDAGAALSQVDPWKHALPKLTDLMIDAEVKTLITLRNPYSWFLSLARHPYHLKGPPTLDLESFASRPWMTERRENMPAVLASPMTLWSHKLAGYKAYCDAALAQELEFEYIIFEDFVTNGYATLCDALEAMQVSVKGMRPLAHNTKATDLSPSGLALYYRQEVWRQRLTSGLIRRLNVHINWELASEFGYLPLDPDDFPDRLAPELMAKIAREMTGLGMISDRETGAASAT